MVKTAIRMMCFICTLCLGLSCVEQRPKILDNTDISLEPFMLEVSADHILFDSPQSDSRILQVKASNVKWTFSEIPDWITISPQSGSGDMEVSIQVSENSGAISRVGLLSFGTDGGDWNYSVGITVSQQRAPYVITLPVDFVDMDGGGEIKTVQVDTNTDNWSIQIPLSMSQWCTARKTEDGIVLTVTANTGNESREGLIELRSDDVSAFLSVIQRPAGIITTTDRLVFPVDGGVQSLPVNVEAAWTIETSYSWIDIKTSSGQAGFVMIPMEAVPNFSSKPRDGFIYIVLSDDRKIEIPVHQDCIEFSLDRDSIHFQSGGSIERLVLKSNVNWFIPDSIDIIDWISINPMAGNGNMQLLVKVDANLNIDSRSVSVPVNIVSKADSTTIISSRTIEIIQDSRSFGADSTSLSFSDKAGSTWLNIKSDGYWFLNPMESWIMVEPDEGDRNAQVKVSVAENLEREARTGSIILRTYGERNTISVYQSGKYIDVSSSALDFHSRPDTTEVILTTNGHWTAESKQPWVKLSESEGYGDCVIMISVSDNPSISEREGEVSVTREGMNPIRIKVTQKGHYLTVSTNRIEFFSAGGKSAPIIVQTDGVYTIQTESDWVTIDKETESQFTVSVTENISSNSRNGIVNVSLSGLVKDTLVEIAITQRSVEDSYTPTGYVETYGYVDLGLSVNWATYNVGATAPEEFGDYYAWGETEPKGNYLFDNYYFCTSFDWDAFWNTFWDDEDDDGAGVGSFNKYVIDSDWGIIDNKTILETDDDVAQVKWGGGWRMPTYGEWHELLMKCDWIKTTWRGVDGFKVTSKVPGYTDCFIFLPTAGVKGSAMVSGKERTAEGNVYWSSSLDNSFSAMGLDLFSEEDSLDLVSLIRFLGAPVRPVLHSESFVVSSITLDKKTLSLKTHDSSSLCVTTVDGKDDVRSYPITWSSSDAGVVRVSYSGAEIFEASLDAISPGTAIVTATIGAVQSSCTVTVTSSATPEYVDLGLSVNWATFNVGADSPEESGDYYAWGETERKTDYSWSTYEYCNGSANTLTKYNYDIEFGTVVDNKVTLDAEDDVAHVRWGGDWRIPTREEYDELINNCTWTQTTLGGVNGYLVTSNKPGYTDKSIFLPAAGYRKGTDLINNTDWYGDFWSSSLYESSPEYAWELHFLTDTTNAYYRCYGVSVRPVCPSESYILNTVATIELSDSLLDISLGDTVQITATPKNKNGDAIDANVQWRSSDEDVARVYEGIIIAVGSGDCSITAYVDNVQASCNVAVLQTANNHEYVDLGLSVSWATCNIGANSPEEYGDYYAWGEIEVKSNYEWSTYKYGNGTNDSINVLTKYNSDIYYGTVVDYKTKLDTEDDVAYVKWGGLWRLPTDEEFKELIDSCTWTWKMQSGVNGYLVTSNRKGYTDRSIFIPAAGMREETSLYSDGVACYYWSSSIPADRSSVSAWYLSGYRYPNIHALHFFYRCYGQSVRPVYGWPNHEGIIDDLDDLFN